MAKNRLIQIDVNGEAVPLKIIRESRSNGRVSLGKREVILRYPDALFSRGESYYIGWAREWLSGQHTQSPDIFHRYNGQNLTDNQLTILEQTFGLDLKYEDRKSGTVNLLDKDLLQLKIPSHFNIFDKVEMRRRLLSSFVAKAFLPRIKKEVDAINATHFQKEIQAVRLKYNRSNWGSCSTKKNINLSTRLLLAPEPAVRYVIIHELCHLIEMNHSPAFYKEVATRCPNFREQERWLNENYMDF